MIVRKKKRMNAASCLSMNKICGLTVLECAFAQLNKSYAVDKSLQLDSDFSAFLNSMWDKSLKLKTS